MIAVCDHSDFKMDVLRISFSADLGFFLSLPELCTDARVGLIESQERRFRSSSHLKIFSDKFPVSLHSSLRDISPARNHSNMNPYKKQLNQTSHQ